MFLITQILFKNNTKSITLRTNHTNTNNVNFCLRNIGDDSYPILVADYVLSEKTESAKNAPRSRANLD